MGKIIFPTYLLSSIIGAIEVTQGEDMDMRSRIHAAISPTLGSPIEVPGTARLMA